MPIFKKLLFMILLVFITSKLTLANTEEEKDVDVLPLNEIRTFTEIFSKIKNDYVENINDKKLLENAIRGMLQGLDPHSAYLDKEAYRELQEGTSGKFGGLGIEVTMQDGLVKIVAPIENMRFDDTIYNVFGDNLESVTSNHQLIPNIGTYDGRDLGGKYCPGILLNSFDLTL